MKTRDLLTLSQLPGITLARMRAIIPQAKVLPFADENAMRRLAENHRWFTVPDSATLRQANQSAEELLAMNKKHGIHIVSQLDDKYPVELSAIKDAPALLFFKGNISLLDEAQQERVAVIGSRTIVPRTQRVGKTITHLLLKAGKVIVSGLALGSDSLAHQAAVDAFRPTIAVLAGGLDKIISVFQSCTGPSNSRP